MEMLLRGTDFQLQFFELLSTGLATVKLHVIPPRERLHTLLSREPSR